MGCRFVSRIEKDLHLVINLSGWHQMMAEKTIGQQYERGMNKGRGRSLNFRKGYLIFLVCVCFGFFFNLNGCFPMILIFIYLSFIRGSI